MQSNNIGTEAIMKVTARVMESGAVIGYEVSNTYTGEKAILSKQQAWGLARNGAIQDVKNVSSDPEQGLTGTNGFELKKLKVINMQDVTKGYVNSSIARHAEDIFKAWNKKDVAQIRSLGEKWLKADTEAGVINMQNGQSAGDLYKVIGLVVNNKTPKILELLPKKKEQISYRTIDAIEEAIMKNTTEPYDVVFFNKLIKEKLSFLLEGETCNPQNSKVFGYLISNEQMCRTKYVKYNRNSRTLGPDGTLEFPPLGKVYMSNIEAALWSTDSKINGKLHNAVLDFGSSIQSAESVYDMLSASKFVLDDSVIPLHRDLLDIDSDIVNRLVDADKQSDIYMKILDILFPGIDGIAIASKMIENRGIDIKVNVTARTVPLLLKKLFAKDITGGVIAKAEAEFTKGGDTLAKLDLKTGETKVNDANMKKHAFKRNREYGIQQEDRDKATMQAEKLRSKGLFGAFKR